MGLFDGLISKAKDKVSDVLDDVFGEETVDTVTKIAKTAATAYALKKAYDYMTTPEDNTPQQPTLITNAASSSQGSASQNSGTTINTTQTGSSTIQIGASSDASIPVLYGRAKLRGTIFDAILTNGNANLLTAVMIAERPGIGPNGNADYTVNKVYFNDAELNLNADGTVANAILNDGSVSTKYNTNTKVRVYAGSVYTLPDSFYGATPTYDSATTVMPHWKSYFNFLGGGTVFAIIEQQYDAANGVQGLGTWTFDITNTTFKNPGDVVYDYLTNARYGAGYDTDLIDANSFIGSDENSLKTRGDATEIFLSLDPDDDANADISNSTAFPQLVTQGNINNYTNVAIATYGANSILTANAMTPGIQTVTFTPADFEAANRLKIFWANTTTAGNINNSLTGTNSFTAFLDIARVLPDGKFSDYPGDDANVSGTIYDITLAPNTAITNFLTKGDKIRPEGSPFIYTVAANVDVPSPGYRTFQIPVYERIAQMDFANVEFGNVTAGTQISAANSVFPSIAEYKNDYELIGRYRYGGWPFSGATTGGAFIYPGEYTTESNVLFSNCLVGNVIMSSPQADSVVLGTESRCEINGVISTENTIEQNLAALLAHSEATLTYDVMEGKWKGIPLGNSNITGAYEFTDDNIIQDVKITTADFDSFYNKVRAGYVDQNYNAVKKEVILYTPDSEKSTNEPPKQMELNYPFAGTSSRTARLAGIELAQNRQDLVLQFRSDYSSIIVKPGDIVKVSVASYGFNEKLFRILRAKQLMSDDILTMEFTAIEYDPSLYTSASDGGGEAAGAAGGGSGAGFGGGGSGSGLGNPEGNPNPISDAESGFDPETYTDLTDGSGVNFPDGSIDGSKIANGTIDASKVSFTLPSADGLCLNTYYEQNGGGTINIIGASAPDYNRISFYAPNTGVYTFKFSFITPIGAQDAQFGSAPSWHNHPTVPGSIDVTGTDNITASNISGNGSMIFRAAWPDAPETNGELNGNYVPEMHRYGHGRVTSAVTMRFYPSDAPFVPPSGGTYVEQDYSITTYGSSGQTIDLVFSLSVAGGSTTTCEVWDAIFDDQGIPTLATNWNLPNNNGLDFPEISRTTLPFNAGISHESNVFVVSPHVQMTGSGNITLT